MARELRDLAPQDAADLTIAAGRQLELARLFDRLLQEMDQAGAQLRQSDPLAAELVADALGEARRLAIAAEMRSAGDQIRQNQIGEATAGQEQIAKGLQEVLDVLANRARQEAVRLVKKLRELQTDLAAVQSREEGLQKEIAAAAKNQDQDARRRELERLAAGQRELRDETQRLARQLERLQSATAARAAVQAAAQMDQSQGRAGQGDCAARPGTPPKPKSRWPRPAANLTRRCKKPRPSWPSSRLPGWKTTSSIFAASSRGRWKRPAGSGDSRNRRDNSIVRRRWRPFDLARLQHSLQVDTARLGRQLTAAAPFALALDGAAADMGRAAEALDRRETGSATQDAQRGAVHRLDLLLEALKPEPPTCKAATRAAASKADRRARKATASKTSPN